MTIDDIPDYHELYHASPSAARNLTDPGSGCTEQVVHGCCHILLTGLDVRGEQQWDIGMIPHLTVVTPMRNEEETTPIFLERLMRALSSNASSWRIIVPLTATDRTAEILENYPVEQISVPPGLGLAYSVGLSRALSYPGPVLTMDTDLSHLPEEMNRLISSEGDLVLGARESTDAPLHRRLVSRTVNAALRGPCSDYTSAYRLYSHSVLQTVLPSVRSKGFAFLPEIVFRALRAGLRVSEVRVSFPPRVAGASKMSYRSNLRDYVRFLAWRYRP